MNLQLTSTFTPRGGVIALNIFNEVQHYNLEQKTLALRYIFQNKKSFKPSPKIRDLVTFGKKVFRECMTDRNIELAREVSDVLVTHSTDGRDLFEEFENKDTQDNKVIEEKKETLYKKDSMKTVYQDSQNVHNSTLNKSVIRALEFLYARYSYILNIQDFTSTELADYKKGIFHEMELDLTRMAENLFPEGTTNSISHVFKFVRGNIAVFGDKRITLMDGFISVWFYASEHTQSTEIKERMIQEIHDMKGLCTTGHISRIINSIQGYTSSPELEINIGTTDQITSVVKNYLTKCLSECKDDDIYEGAISDDIHVKGKYITFVKRKIIERILLWKKEYGEECLTDVVKAVNAYTNEKVFV